MLDGLVMTDKVQRNLTMASHVKLTQILLMPSCLVWLRKGQKGVEQKKTNFKFGVT